MKDVLGVVLALLLVVGCGYPRPADLSIVVPETGTTISHHRPLEFAVDLRDADAASFAIEIDGVPASELRMASSSGRNCNDCNYQFSWPSLEVPEGVHEITVLALDAGDAPIAAGSVSLVFDDTPELRAMIPAALDLPGVREVTLGVDFIERGPASVRVSVDGLGELWTEQSRAGTDCRFGCSWSRPWSTAQLPAGLYKISVVIEDDDGHRIESVQTATIDDIVHVTALQVTGETDSGLLDMEVHVFDSANQFVGCAGNPGLEGVDISDILYTVDAPIVLPNGQLLRGMDVGTRAVRFEVWEDDSAPCPSPVTSFDDLLGASPNRSLANWKLQPQPMSFGRTTALAIEVGRPYLR